VLVIKILLTVSSFLLYNMDRLKGVASSWCGRSGNEIDTANLFGDLSGSGKPQLPGHGMQLAVESGPQRRMKTELITNVSRHQNAASVHVNYVICSRRRTYSGTAGRISTSGRQSAAEKAN
jgi:hypothetical protein